MAAPSLTALLDQESQFLYAVQSILSDASITAALPGDDAALPDDCTLIKFTRGPAIGDQDKRPNTRIEYTRFTGTLEIVSRMRRSSNTASAVVGCYRLLYERRGKIRALFLKSERKFTEGKLPWLAVNDIRPLSGESGVADSDDAARDAFTEKWQIDYEIRRDAWPS